MNIEIHHQSVTFLGSKKNNNLVNHEKYVEKIKKNFFDLLIHGEIDEVYHIYKEFMKRQYIICFLSKYLTTCVIHNW